MAVRDCAQQCDIEEYSHRLIKTLSKGIKQRISIAQAIIHKPKLILLDEPGDGLDPHHLVELRRLINTLAKDHAIVLSTHQIEDVKQCCQQILILNKGKPAYYGDLSIFEQSLELEHLHAHFLKPPKIDQIKSIEGVYNVEQQSDNQFLIHGQPGEQLTQSIMQVAVSLGWNLNEIYPQEHNLDSLFHQIIGSELS